MHDSIDILHDSVGNDKLRVLVFCASCKNKRFKHAHQLKRVKRTIYACQLKCILCKMIDSSRLTHILGMRFNWHTFYACFMHILRGRVSYTHLFKTSLIISDISGISINELYLSLYIWYIGMISAWYEYIQKWFHYWPLGNIECAFLARHTHVDSSA